MGAQLSIVERTEAYGAPCLIAISPHYDDRLFLITEEVFYHRVERAARALEAMGWTRTAAYQDAFDQEVGAWEEGMFGVHVCLIFQDEEGVHRYAGSDRL